MQICLLESKINGKLASIQEIARCHEPDSQGKKYEEKCNAQRYYLDQMKKSLDLADDLKTKRTNSTGNAYELLSAEIDHQFGEYWFKQSQYYTENLRYRDSREADEKKELVREEEELKKKSYGEAEQYYRSALDFYRKYPEQYRLQEAGVLRNMADLYCRMGKGAMCYQVLEEAYLDYRSYNNLHGIADILQSMGEMEDFTKGQPAVGRSGLCFYKAAAKLYRTLGDGAIM